MYVVEQIENIKNIKSHLSAEEQKELARRYHAGDQKAGDLLVETNMAWVLKYVKKYANNEEELKDLMQRGAEALCRARDKYDPDSDTKFLSYAQFWLRSYTSMESQILKPIRTDRGRVGRKIFNNFYKTIRNLKKKDVNLTPKNIAEEIGGNVEEDDVIMFMLVNNPIRLNIGGRDRARGGQASEKQDALEAPEEDLDSRVDAKRVMQLLKDFGKSLEGRDKIIWYKRVISIQPKLLKELARMDEFDVTKERVRQLEVKVKKKFNEFAKERGFDEVGF